PKFDRASITAFSGKHPHTEPAQARLLPRQMVIRPSCVAAVIILQTSSGSIRNVSSLSNVTRTGVAPIFASTVTPAGRRSSGIISARAVERVIGISRVTVDADITAIAAQLDLPLRRVVAWLAQRL